MKNIIIPNNVTTALVLLFILTSHIQAKAQYFPDEEIFDTTGIIEETFADGIDTIWYWDDGISDSATIINLRTASGNNNTYSNNNNQYAKIKGDSTIYINFGSVQKTVNQGLNGFHVAGIFGRKQIPNDSSALDQWNWMSNFAPNSLRFPGGADSKFMHLLQGSGYGYVLEEIIRFYDRTDGVDNAPEYATIFDSLDIGASETFYLDWIAEKEVQDFKSFGNSYLEQQLLDSTHRYIDDFIEMIKKIETENSGHSVEVVVDLNIMNETATECKRIVDYLRGTPIANGNSIHDVNVTYVELGNEMYYEFSEKMLGIYELEDYWTYINGGITDSLDSVLIGSDVWFDHDYISAFKKPLTGSCKIALPAENIHDKTFALQAAGKVEGVLIYSDWNDSLFTKRMEKVEITGWPGHYRKSYDAYTIHPYYDGHNYDSIPFTHLENTYVCNLGDTITTNDGWSYDTYDARLESTFDGISRNFKAFLKTRYLESWNEHKTHLGLNLSVAEGGKDVITSEYNFKDQGNYSPTEVNQIGVFSQSFVHCAMLQEWWLKNLKINYDANYRANFFKYAHLHNFAGGGSNPIMSPASDQELVWLGKDISPYNINDVDSAAFRNYYMKRSTFYVMQLLSEITKKDLKYIQCNFVIAKNNPNVQPTVFIDPEKENFYIYFTNVTDDPQQHNLNIAGTTGIYPPDGLLYVSDTATIYCVTALKPYSTAGKGKNTLFTLNECYNNVNDVPYPIEITTIDTFQNCCTDNLLYHIEVPPYSFGYIKVPISADYPPYEKITTPAFSVNVYPNPASTSLHINVNGKDFTEMSNFKVKIVNMVGSVCYNSNIQNNNAIDITGMSAGFYSLTIELSNGTILNKQFVKQ